MISFGYFNNVPCLFIRDVPHNSRALAAAAYRIYLSRCVAAEHGDTARAVVLGQLLVGLRLALAELEGQPC